MLRSSRSETNRFADAAAILRNESEALEVRMRTVNEEIAMAREFLGQNALELESIGRQSANGLVEAAEKLGEALSDSDAKAKTLETVSNAAANNLDELRKHLPVVTSAAKDVTNQIGSAGNSAQLQVKTLISALQKVANAGKEAHSNIEGVEERAAEASTQLSQLIGNHTETLDQSMSNAGERTQDLTDQLNSSGEAIAAQITAASADIDKTVDQNISKLTQQVEMLRESLGDMTAQSDKEDERLEKMIARVSSHLEDRSAQLEVIDEDATERSAKLAFAVEALVLATGQLNENLEAGHSNADVLVERSERLLTALDTAKKELDETLPDAITRTDECFAGSLDRLKEAADNALSLDEHSDNMLAKLTTIDQLIAAQSESADTLMAASNEHFDARKQQADTLIDALTKTRGLMDEITENASSGLSETLKSVKESTQKAADESRKIMEDEMATVSEKLSTESYSSLKTAIDSQVAALNEMVQKSLEDGVSLSGAATQKLTGQLSQIDSMTANLERRLSDAQSSFDGIEDDSFARQMAMLTDSLNSRAIDVAKILSNEVTDTSWAAYLKGDRGVFTRRAVRLLDSGEAKAIVAHYDEEPEFREHVNRYIHDFESMMRVLLSTRDGNAIGVTLLSSDVGKLYVALAQAIERLRAN